MSESANVNDVFLSLDPNLIYVTNDFPTPKSISKADKEHEGIDDDVDMTQTEGGLSTEGKLEENEETSNNSHFQHLKHLKKSLVNNPYETYGSLPLNEFIPLILRQRGIQFSDLTNEYLERELSKLNKQGDEDVGTEADSDTMDITNDNVTVDPDMSEMNEKSTTTLQLSLKEFNKTKKEIYDSINMALNESSLSLELVSLLLSGVRSRQGMATMSPFLRNSVAPGSLTTDKITLNKLSQADAAEKHNVSIGWKLRSLKEAQQMLKNNYNTLSQCVKKEQNFWGVISNNISDEDAVFKIRDRTTGEKSLGVQYGYSDSGSTYKGDKGVAILKNVSDSSKTVEQDVLEVVPIHQDTLDRKTGVSKPIGYYIKIRIYKQLEDESDYILTGESSLNKDTLGFFKDGEIENNIKAQINRLKFTVFEQELFYQMRKETNELFKYGCNIENENKISIEIAQEKFEIEILPADLDVFDTFDQIPSKTDDKRANVFLSLLRMLLVVMYKKKLLNDRTQQPLYVKEKNNSYNPPLLIIKPLLGKMRHNHYYILLKKIITDCILNTVDGSKLVEVETSSSAETTSEEHQHSKDPNIKVLQSDISVFQSILDIPVSTMNITLPNNVNYQLVLKSPNYCNILIQLKVPGKDILEFTEFKELEDYLNYSISGMI